MKLFLARTMASSLSQSFDSDEYIVRQAFKHVVGFEILSVTSQTIPVKSPGKQGNAYLMVERLSLCSQTMIEVNVKVLPTCQLAEPQLECQIARVVAGYSAALRLDRIETLKDEFAVVVSKRVRQNGPVVFGLALFARQPLISLCSQSLVN